MDKSHERTMMDMRKNHKQDLDRLRLEKDQLLMEETQATQAGTCIVYTIYVEI